MKRLADKVALITGGGRGLGRAFVDRYLDEGARVAILEIDPESTAQTVAACEQRGFEVLAVVGDVALEDDVAKTIAALRDRWGRIDILMNNAGVATEGKAAALTELDVAQWRRIFDVNVTGAMFCIRHAAPVMRTGGGGSIVNMTSIAARASYPGRGAYAPSKAALESLTGLAAIELGAWNIRVNAMSLGWFRTAFNEHVYRRPGELERRNLTIPIGRIGTVEDAANLAVFLASDESSYISGESIEIDGGLLAAGLQSAGELARVRPL